MRSGCSPTWKPSRKTSATRSGMRTRKLKGRNSVMADPVLKFPAEQKASPPLQPATKVAAQPRRRLLAGLRKYRRFLLLVVLPLAAVTGGVVFFLNGGGSCMDDDPHF